MTNTRPDGHPVPPGVVLVPVPADAAARAALTARVTVLAGVRHPHLVAVLEVRTVREGALDVVHARGEAADLPAVLAVRGRLAAGEAAAVGVHVAQALAALHAAGVVHGPVEAGDVVLRPGGAPALRPRAGVPPEEWTAAEDVRAAARLVDGLLGSRPVAGTPAGRLDGDPLADPDGALRDALRPALGADARRRPEAGTLAALVDAACEPAMVGLPDPATLAGAALAGARRGVVGGAADVGAGTGRRFRATRGAVPRAGSAARVRAVPGAPRARRLPWSRPGGRSPAARPALVVVGIGLTVGLMTGAALELSDRAPAGADASAPADAAGPTAPARGTDPVLARDEPGAAAAALTQRRLDLLAAAADHPDLGAVDVAGSPAYAADAALLARLRTAGTRPQQPRAAVTSSEVVAADGTSATVRLTYAVEAHEQVAADGTRTAVPASGARTATLDLAWTDDGWRVAGVA
ncbi:hypothetical protein [Xylanimonas protaetiae]|uniref:Protein kinase domain-containing protein n=1 Tax=Xylanimonas protaetiae TaxID=2509457 RepID=A0A4P6FCQ7_9MICO|nr:hypothetical protein [Xylanimonas protaetiae]QAY71337.1 hypothetical protein ET471_15935 [Xylanimonas protaetiae]